ncbi:hypothetical protein SAMN05421878_10893 [Actinobaculum suis]|uniref:Transmembrane protein n=1 Tax=Actinobaculum suis TaxID=1657 RepID=A0A1G7CSN6_9ACTO|nr:hypothetical protein SAMN05421878_10893 [Actinobaculum suis]
MSGDPVVSDSRTPNKFPPAGVYALGLLWLGIIVALAFAVDVKTAAYVLGGSLIAYAGARAILPTGAIPRVRSRRLTTPGSPSFSRRSCLCLEAGETLCRCSRLVVHHEVQLAQVEISR